MSKSQLQIGRNANWDLDEATGEALVKTKEMQLKYVEVGDIAYLGKAVFGAATSAELWQIRKIDYSTGVEITAANDAEFDQIWDDRASLTYT